MESIRTYMATGLPTITGLTSPKQNAGVCGAGRGLYIGEVRGPFTNLQALQTDYNNTGATLTDDGQTAVCLFARDFFANGGKKLYVTEPTMSAVQTITCTGNGTQRSFDLIVDKTGGAGALTLSPVPGTMHVEHPIATDLVYGVDWICDWSQGIVHFAVAPAAAANNIQIEWQEYTAANVQTALALFETKPIRLVSVAYGASDNGYVIEDEIDTHCDNSFTFRRGRIGFIEGYYRDTANLIAGPGAYDSDWCTLWANRSGWFNDNLDSPNVTWQEFIDPTACIMGVASSVNPWISLHEKPVKNLNQVDDFDSTEVGNLYTAHVNYFAYDGVSGFNAKDGFNIEGASATFRWVDAVRTWLYVEFRLRKVLREHNFIGNAQISRSPILHLEQTILNELKLLYAERAIDNPDDLSLYYDDYKSVMSELIEAFKLDTEDREPEQLAYILARRADRTEVIYVFYLYNGVLHYIDLYLGGL